jgi:hypothetical protein
MTTRFALGLAALSTLALACSEANDDADGEDGGSGGSDATSSTTKGASGSTGANATVGAGGGGSGDLVVNEISGGDDWVELYNRGTMAIDLGGLTLADQDMPGVPKLDEAISFPAGTTLAPGAFLFILVKQETVMPGEAQPQTTCAPGPSPCFHAPFGISATDGDAIYVIDGQTVVANAEFPAMAVSDTQTYCRLPDGGSLAPCAPTPGAANAAP